MQFCLKKEHNSSFNFCKRINSLRIKLFQEDKFFKCAQIRQNKSRYLAFISAAPYFFANHNIFRQENIKRYFSSLDRPDSKIKKAAYNARPAYLEYQIYLGTNSPAFLAQKEAPAELPARSAGAANDKLICLPKKFSSKVRRIKKEKTAEQVFYFGMLGGRRKREKMREAFFIFLFGVKPQLTMDPPFLPS